MERNTETAATRSHQHDEPAPRLPEQPNEVPQPPSQPVEVPQPPSQPDEMPQLPDQPHPPGNPPTVGAADEREAGEKAASPDADDRSHGEQYPGPAEDAATGDPYATRSPRPPKAGADEPSPRR